MRIAWKTCGGCNPRYDRQRVLYALEALFLEKGTLEPTNIGREYDLVFLVGGCPACCIEKETIPVAEYVVRIGSMDDLERWKGCDSSELERFVPG